jgi:predicted peptidase
MKKSPKLFLVGLLLMLITSVSADEQVPRTGYFSVSSTLLELLGEQGASAVSEVFAADEKLRWRLVVPKTYDPAHPPGVIVFVNRGNWGGGKKSWNQVLEEKNLIWIGALDAGDQSPMNERMFKALLAPTILARDYAIDPQRIYISGFVGGAHVAGILSTTKPELFQGGLFMSGATFWGDKMPPKLDRLRQNRFVFLAGANDVARTKATRTAESYKKAGLQNTNLIIVPNMRQELPGKSYFEEAVTYLDVTND